MPFIVFEQKNTASLDIPSLACNDLLTKIDHDFPTYVRQLPAIYDDIERVCHQGRDACLAYLSKFEPDVEVDVPTPTVPEPEPVVVPTSAPEPVPSVEPKKKATRVRKPKKVESTE